MGVADRRMKQRQPPAPPKPEYEPKVWKAQSERPRIWTAKDQISVPYHKRQLNRYEEEEEEVSYYEYHQPSPYMRQPYGYY